MTFNDQGTFEEHMGLVFGSNKALTLVKFRFVLFSLSACMGNKDALCDSLVAQGDNTCRISILEFLKKFNLLCKSHLACTTVSIRFKKCLMYETLVNLFIYCDRVL